VERERERNHRRCKEEKNNIGIMKMTQAILGLVLLGVYAIDAVSIQHAKMLRHGKEPGSVTMNVRAEMELVGDENTEDSTSVGIEDTVKAAELVAQSESVTTVDKRFCASVLLAIKKHEAPYWDAEGLDGSGCCSEDRPELLAQCDKKLDGFMKRISDLCPSLSPLDENDFKPVEYVPDVENVKTSKHHAKPPKAMPECPDPCADECECCCGAEDKDEPLARTPNGKPVAEWADHPKAADVSVEMKAKLAEDLSDCDGKPCSADDFESLAEDVNVEEEPAGGEEGASADEAKEAAKETEAKLETEKEEVAEEAEAEAEEKEEEAEEEAEKEEEAEAEAEEEAEKEEEAEAEAEEEAEAEAEEEAEAEAEEEAEKEEEAEAEAEEKEEEAAEEVEAES